MLGLGLAASNTAPMFLPKEDWPKVYSKVQPGVVDLQPFVSKGETPELLQGYIDRINAAFGVFEKQLREYRPDALIIVGSDRGEVFSRANVSALAIFLGEEATGVQGVADLPETVQGTFKIPCHSDLARLILKGLTQRNFYVAYSEEIKPVESSRGNTISHMVSAPLRKLVPNLNIPVIPIFVNVYFPPIMPPAARCWDMGVALRDILASRPERVAILASGGLSYDPAARWVDQLLDHWILDRIQEGKAEALKKLFTFGTESWLGATGEIRAWVTVAGACQQPAKLVDYIPARPAKTGLGFAYWPAS